MDGYTCQEVETQTLPEQFEFKYTVVNAPQEIVTISIDSKCECYLRASTVHLSCVLSPLSFSSSHSLSLSLLLSLHFFPHKQSDRVGCSNYMHPQNATMNGDAINLTCTPVPVNPAEFEGNVTIEWWQFSQFIDLQYFIQNCSRFPENCSNNFRNEDHLIEGGSGDFTLTEYNLTIDNPANNQHWFMPSFTVNDNYTYLAPYTFLYRK